MKLTTAGHDKGGIALKVEIDHVDAHWSPTFRLTLLSKLKNRHLNILIRGQTLHIGCVCAFLTLGFGVAD